MDLKDKELLTVKEASILYNIGQNKIRELINDVQCTYVLINGRKKLIKKRLFTEFLNSQKYI